MIFYTLPPIEIRYPYILLNANRPYISYIRRHHKWIKSVIIDSGVEIFRNPKIKEYPRDHLNKILGLYNECKALGINAYATIPDYPDDYHPRNLWLSGKITNIERTVENVLKITDEHKHINWLIPIQGHYENPRSILKSIERYEEAGILKKYSYFAIANLCTTRRINTIIKTCNLARLFLPDKRLHAFGISLKAAMRLKGIIDSFDSLAWTFPRKPGLASCRGEHERAIYFKNYLQRIKLVIGSPIT